MNKADVDLFARRIDGMRERLVRLFRAGQQGVSQELLASAFDELQAALEELTLAKEMLLNRSRQQKASQAELEDDLLRYEELFEGAPAGYLVTSPDGTIRQANRQAVMLLGPPARQLIGRSLALFVPDGSRREFRSQIAQLCEGDGPHELELRLQPWEGAPIDTLLFVSRVQNSAGRVVCLRWLMHRTAARAVEWSDDTVLEQHAARLDEELALLRMQLRARARDADNPGKAREVGGQSGGSYER